MTISLEPGCLSIRPLDHNWKSTNHFIQHHGIQITSAHERRALPLRQSLIHTWWTKFLRQDCGHQVCCSISCFSQGVLHNARFLSLCTCVFAHQHELFSICVAFLWIANGLNVERPTHFMLTLILHAWFSLSLRCALSPSAISRGFSFDGCALFLSHLRSISLLFARECDPNGLNVESRHRMQAFLHPPLFVALSLNSAS